MAKPITVDINAIVSNILEDREVKKVMSKLKKYHIDTSLRDELDTLMVNIPLVSELTKKKLANLLISNQRNRNRLVSIRINLSKSKAAFQKLEDSLKDKITVQYMRKLDAQRADVRKQVVDAVLRPVSTRIAIIESLIVDTDYCLRNLDAAHFTMKGVKEVLWGEDPGHIARGGR